MTLRRRLVRAAAGSLGLSVTATGLVFASTIVLTRTLDVGGYGIFAFATALAGIIAIPATVGFDQVVLRHVSAYESTRAWPLAHGVMRRAYQVTLGVSCLLAAVVALAVGVTTHDAVTRLAVWVALASVPFITLSRIRYAALASLEHVVLAQIPESLVRPALLLGALLIVVAVGSGSLDAILAVSIWTAAYVIAFAVGTALLARRIPEPIRHARPEYRTAAWLAAAVPLTFLGGATLVTQHVATVVLGAARTPDDAGLFSVAARVAALAAFPLAAVNAALAPTIARLWAAEDPVRLQRALTRSAQATVALSVPGGLALIFLGPWVLGLFGPAFPAAQEALVILTLGQLANAVTGSVGTLLIMTGHQRQTALAVGTAAALNVLLSIVLAPGYGVVGAAAASALSLVGWNVALALYAYRRLGLITTALGTSRSRAGRDISDAQRDSPTL